MTTRGFLNPFAMEKLSVADQWQIYLDKTGLKEATMHPVQLVETKHTFYAGFGEGLAIIHDHLLGKTDDEIRAMISLLFDELAAYWISEMGKKPKFIEASGECMIKDCGKPGAFTVHYELRVTRKGGCATSTPILRVCKDHSDVGFNDVFTDAGWEQICKALESIGRVRPVKEFSGISIIPITSSPKSN